MPSVGVLTHCKVDLWIKVVKVPEDEMLCSDLFIFLRS